MTYFAKKRILEAVLILLLGHLSLNVSKLSFRMSLAAAYFLAWKALAKIRKFKLF